MFSVYRIRVILGLSFKAFLDQIPTCLFLTFAHLLSLSWEYSFKEDQSDSLFEHVSSNPNATFLKDLPIGILYSFVNGPQWLHLWTSLGIPLFSKSFYPFIHIPLEGIQHILNYIKITYEAFSKGTICIFRNILTAHFPFLSTPLH